MVHRQVQHPLVSITRNCLLSNWISCPASASCAHGRETHDSRNARCDRRGADAKEAEVRERRDKGGKTAAARMTKQERAKRARKAAEARRAKEKDRGGR
jgi:hypothetical protein